MSELPRGWAASTLGQLAPLQGGATPKGVLTAPPGADFPFYKVSDMNSGDGRFMSEAKVTVSAQTAAELSLRIVPSGAVIFPKVGGAVRTNKKRILTRPAAVDTNTMAAVPTSAVNARYLYHWLARITLADFAYGAPVPQVSRTRLSEEPFALPPFGEQERIVAAIEEQFSRLDAGVVALQRARQNLKRMRAASFNEAATHSPIAGILENTDGTWPVQPLGELADGPSGIVDGPFGSNLKSVHYTESGPRVLRLQNIGDGEYVEAEAHISRSHFEALRRHDVRPGDLVCAILGDVLPRAIVVPPDLGPAIVKADCPRIRLAEHMNPRFVWAVLNAPSTRQTVSVLIRGVGRPRLTVRALRQIPIPVPPRNVQDAVVQQLDSLLDASAALDRAVSQADTRQAAARSSILAAAFSGQLVPQDPIDEPASVLLARIAGERAASNGHNAARTRESRQKVSA